jgi:hypothetical protein
MRTTYKQRARRLQTSIQKNLGVACSLSQAYDIVANEENYPNWETLSANIPESPEPVPSKRSPWSWELQYYCAQFVKRALQQGYKFDSIIEMLQQDEEVGDQWRKVNLNYSSSAPQNILYQAFEQTECFDPSALRYLKMAKCFDSTTTLDLMIECMRENRTTRTT